MTQEEFFATVEWNIKQLVQEYAPLPEYNLPCRNLKMVRWTHGVFRARKLLQISDSNTSLPRNVRVWDLVGMRLFSGRPLKFRVFACYSEDATTEDCQQIKFNIRKWYELSGLSGGSTRPYSCAMVFGLGKEPAESDKPTGFDLPDRTPFEMWTWSGDKGPEVRCFGEGSVGQIVSRALTAETFDKCKDRVKKAVDSELDFGIGTVTVECIAEKTKVHEDIISNIFFDLVKSGKYEIKKKPSVSESGQKLTPAQRIYIEKGAPGRIQQMIAQRRGKWFVQDSFAPMAVFGIGGIAILLTEHFMVKFASKTLANTLVSAVVTVMVTIIIVGMAIAIIRFLKGGN